MTAKPISRRWNECKLNNSLLLGLAPSAWDPGVVFLFPLPSLL